VYNQLHRCTTCIDRTNDRTGDICRDGKQLSRMALSSSKTTARSWSACVTSAGEGRPPVLGSARRTFSGSRREGHWKVAAETRFPDTASTVPVREQACLMCSSTLPRAHCYTRTLWRDKYVIVARAVSLHQTCN